MSFGGVEIAKAGPPAGVATRDAADVMRALQGILERNAMQRQDLAGRPLPRDPAWWLNEFGPNLPLPPEGLDPPRTDTGQPPARLTQYEVGYNLLLGREKHIGWETLKKASESPLFRACIELRKTELSTMDWQIRVNPKVASRIAQQSGRNKDEVAAEMRTNLQPEIDRLTDFWEVPDRKNGRDFSEWIGLAMDEQLTWDALAIYPHMTYGKDLLGLWIVDGSTIKPLLDETGGRPEAPYPAYQQLLYGFPRGEYTAQVVTQDGKEVIPGAILAGQLIYRRRTPRSWTPYGYSATEQALLDGLLYNRRQHWMLSEYTDGVVPAQFMESDGTLDWTPEQLLQYERDFNDALSGQTAARMRARFLPPGFRAALMTQVGERYRPDYDLHLVKLVAMHFLLTITELGFTEQGGLGSTGYHEGQEDINFRKGRLPDIRWYGDLCSQISQTHLNMPKELEFAFLGLDSEDEASADELDHNRVADGRMTLNEARAKLGLPAYSFEEANMPQMQTARGVVFFEGASKIAPPGILVEPASEQVDSETGDAAAGGKPTSTTKPKSSVGGQASKEATLDEWQEVTKYQKWCSETAQRNSRKFEFHHVTEDRAEELGLYMERADFSKAGGSGPKGSASSRSRSGQAGRSTSSWSPYSDLS